MILEGEHIQQALEGTGWLLKGKSIVKTFSFDNFLQSIQFVNAVADIAESENHYPEIDIRNTRVKLSLTTPEEGGVTEVDIDIADKIDEVG